MGKYNFDENDEYLLNHNILNIQSHRELKETESFVFSIRAVELAVQTFPFDFTAEGLRKLHRHLFQDIYSFAGEFRDVQLVKDHTHFCQVQYMEAYTNRLFRELQEAGEWHSLEEAAERLAYFKAELNMLHPFREGNGRTIRIFIHAYALSKGFEWNYETMNREQYISAMIHAVLDTRDLKELFLATLEFK